MTKDNLTFSGPVDLLSVAACNLVLITGFPTNQRWINTAKYFQPITTLKLSQLKLLAGLYL